MPVHEWVGCLAGALATVAFVPQVARILRYRQTRDISLGMYVLFTSGVTLWLVYGVLISSISLLIFNSITLLLAVTVLVLKLKNG